MKNRTSQYPGVGCAKSRLGNNVKRTVYRKKITALGQGCSG